MYDKRAKGERYKLVANVYVHGDMYPDNGIMCELSEYLRDKTLVNGYNPDKMFMQVNGMDDLAAQIITYLKNDYTEIMKKFDHSDGNAPTPIIAAGYVYMLPVSVKPQNTDAEYVYEIYPPKDIVVLYTNERLWMVPPPEVPLTELRIKVYSYEWWTRGSEPQLIFAGKLGKFIKKYCIAGEKPIKETA